MKAIVFAALVAFSTATEAQGGKRLGGDVQRPVAQGVERWSPYIREASARFGVPEGWIRRVMRAESGGRTTVNGNPITSSAGAMGLMQLMPKTWAEMRAKHGLGPDPHDPRDNILAGTAYLRAMYDRFGYPGLFGAYNAGPARYAEHLASGRPLPGETRAYLATVGGGPLEPPARRLERPARSIFFALQPAASPPAVRGGKASADLFIDLRGGQ